ncbi:DUF916 and DUF3324 domain-containing protein [Carnobacterium sp.]|uniref:DUF916 and DUF3324 domain-containing protein n=1 Tax=Carnobacterium sp. TaxID=48221 RepID=UPI002FC9A627
MGRLLKWIGIIGFMIGLLFSGAGYVFANEMNFSVQAILPENQRDKKQSYFDLKMEPKQEQVIQIELKNDTEEDIIVETTANTAVTNDNGLADYTKSAGKKDSSLKISFAEIANVPKETLVPKQSSTLLDVQLKMPDEVYDGVLLGGLYFKEKEVESEKTEKEEGAVAIENRFAYSVGVLLTETDVVVQPKLALNEVKADQKTGHNIISLNLQNQHAALVKKLKVDAKIYEQGNKTILYEKKQDDLRMAPNSNFNYAIDVVDTELKPGTYEAEVVANDGYRDWKMKKTFVIESAEAEKLNKSSIDDPPKTFDSRWYILIGGIAVIFVGGIAYWLGRNGRKT